jgi:putative sigma-54 modulation protein
MRIVFTFRQLEPSESLKSYASEKLGKLQKYLHDPLEASVTYSVERRLHCVDVIIHAEGETYLGCEAQEDMYASIDLVVDKIRQQLRRTKTAFEQRRRDALEIPGAG